MEVWREAKTGRGSLTHPAEKGGRVSDTVDVGEKKKTTSRGKQAPLRVAALTHSARPGREKKKGRAVRCVPACSDRGPPEEGEKAIGRKKKTFYSGLDLSCFSAELREEEKRRGTTSPRCAHWRLCRHDACKKNSGAARRRRAECAVAVGRLSFYTWDIEGRKGGEREKMLAITRFVFMFDLCQHKKKMGN